MTSMTTTERRESVKPWCTLAASKPLLPVEEGKVHWTLSPAILLHQKAGGM